MQQSISIYLLCVACLTTWTLYIATRPQSDVTYKLGLVEDNSVQGPLQAKIEGSTTSIPLQVVSKGSAVEESSCLYNANFSRNDYVPIEEGQADGVAFLINIVRNLRAPKIWDDWIAEAFKFISRMALEDSHRVKHSRVLRFYVHYFPLFSEEAVRAMLPPSLKDAIISSPASCASSNLNPCFHRLLQYSSLNFHNAGYFIILGDSTVPLKSFQHMYNSIQKDTRVRSAIKDPCYTQTGNPRTQGALGYPRRIVKSLLRNDSWVHSLWEDGKHGPCAPHECSFWRWVANRRKTNLAKLMWRPKEPKQEHTFFDIPCETYDERGSLQCETITEEWLEDQLLADNVWFGHGLSDQTLVEGSGMELSQYLEGRLNAVLEGHREYSEHTRQRDKINCLVTWTNTTADSLAAALRRERPWGLVE